MTQCLNQFRRLFRQAAERVGESRPTMYGTNSVPIPADDLPPEYPYEAPERPAAGAVALAAPPTASSLSHLTTSPAEVPPQTEENRHARIRRLAALHCEAGWARKQAGDHAGAVAAYTEALTADPSCAEAHLERGSAHRLSRRFDEALRDLGAAIELGTGGEAHFRRALTYSELGQYDPAFADYDEAIRQNPDHAQAYLNRGLTALVVGQLDRAAEDAEHALKIDPFLIRARFLRGMAFGKLGRHDLAAPDLDAVIAAEPDNVRAHNHRGLAHVAAEEYEAAVASYSEALRISPEFGAAFFNRACAYRLLGDHSHAVSEFTAYLRARPDHAPAYHQHGLAYLGREEFDPAIADFTRAFQLDPSLIEAYTSCLEATQAKYESARVAAPEPGPRLVAAESPPTPKAEPAPARSVANKDSGTVPAPARPRPEPAVVKPEPLPSPTTETRLDSPSGLAEPTLIDTPSPLPAPACGKLQLECPECGTAGLLDLRNLGKKFRCPGCEIWWRMSTGGDLEEADAPTGEAPPVRSKTSGSESKPTSKSVPSSSKSSPAMPALPPAAAVPGKGASAATAAAPPRVVGRGRRRKQEGGLRYLTQWTWTAARTKGGLAFLGVCVIVFLCFVPLLFPSLFPSELLARSTRAAHAWLARDVEGVKTFAETSEVESVPGWMKAVPPPDLGDQKDTSEVSVSVDRNDGQSADVVIQVKSTAGNGKSGFYVYRQRWVNKQGTWYVVPDIPASAAPARMARGGR